MGRQWIGRGARNEVLETGKQARRRGLFGRRFLGHAERSPTRGREGRTEGSGPCRFLMSRDATRHNAITMTPACMGRSGIHFTRERVGSKKTPRSFGLRSSWKAKGATFPWFQEVGGPFRDDVHRHLPRENGQRSGGGERGEKVRFVR